jgi:hypothetical protein
MKIILEATSQGARGDDGYRKRYTLEQLPNGDSVEVSWGRAELWYARKRKQHWFNGDTLLASIFIDEQVEKKLKKGYEVVDIIRHA